MTTTSFMCICAYLWPYLYLKKNGPKFVFSSLSYYISIRSMNSKNIYHGRIRDCSGYLLFLRGKISPYICTRLYPINERGLKLSVHVRFTNLHYKSNLTCSRLIPRTKLSVTHILFVIFYGATSDIRVKTFLLVKGTTIP